MITANEWIRQHRQNVVLADPARFLERTAIHVWELYVCEQIDWDTFIACVQTIETAHIAVLEN